MQIGEWIVKVDMENEIVSVISEDNIDLMENLIDGVENKGIYKFTTEDEVLELLQIGVKGTIDNRFKIKWWQRCKERKVSARRDAGASSFGIDNFVRYYRAGIYFSLFAKSKIIIGWPEAAPLRVDIYGSYKFEDRCDRSYSRTWRSGYNAGINNKKGDKVVLKVYAHWKTLRQYKLEANIKITWTNGGIEESGLMRITDGY